MDIDQQVKQIVDKLITEITGKVQVQVMQTIDQQVREVIEQIDYNKIIGDRLVQRIDERLSSLNIDSESIQQQLQNRIDKMSVDIGNVIKNRSFESVQSTVNQKIGEVDFNALFNSALASAVKTDQLEFPDSSISGRAIDTRDLKISGNNVTSGIITDFGSTGIDDKATACQLSIFDETTVIENNLLTKDLTVKGTATIEGDLVVTGTVPENSAMFLVLVDKVSTRVRTGLNEDLFDGYAALVSKRILENGLDLNRITLNGEEIVNGGNLSNKITFSNLQRVGTLHELRVSGESLLSQTLYTTNKRIGINTMEPAQALSIWDQEVEIGFGKRTTDTAVIDVPRRQSLLISVNNKNNIKLTPDGGTVVNSLQIGGTVIGSGNTPPNYDASQGTVIFNSNPQLGGPLGWVSLGGARWANFGFVD
jgi:hypothetical protein